MDLANLEEQLVGHHLQPPTLLPSPARWEGSGNQESPGSSGDQRSGRGFLPTPGNFLLPDTTPASLMDTTLEPRSPLSTTPHSITLANGGWAPLQQPSRCCAPPRPPHPAVISNCHPARVQPSWLLLVPFSSARPSFLSPTIPGGYGVCPTLSPQA